MFKKNKRLKHKINSFKKCAPSWELGLAVEMLGIRHSSAKFHVATA
jgi:hypothetical protein